MTKRISDKKIQIIVTDIEGTTTATSFLNDTLYAYAKEHLHDFLFKNREKQVIKKLCEQVRIEAKLPQITLENTYAILKLWMEQNQKFTSLKALEGLIWEQGFTNGVFKGHIFDDAFRHLKKWKAAGIPLFLFSSDSIYSQKLLFQHSTEGNIASFFSGHFDTTLGCKKLSTTYKKIVQELNCDPSKILFLSHSLEELDAAKISGMQTTLVRRSSIMPPICPHPIVKNFDEIETCFEIIKNPLARV